MNCALLLLFYLPLIPGSIFISPAYIYSLSILDNFAFLSDARGYITKVDIFNGSFTWLDSQPLVPDDDYLGHDISHASITDTEFLYVLRVTQNSTIIIYKVSKDLQLLN